MEPKDRLLEALDRTKFFPVKADEKFPIWVWPTQTWLQEQLRLRELRMQGDNESATPGR